MCTLGQAALLDVVGERGPLSVFLVTPYTSVSLRSLITLGTTVRFSETDTPILGFLLSDQVLSLPCSASRHRKADPEVCVF